MSQRPRWPFRTQGASCCEETAAVFNDWATPPSSGLHGWSFQCVLRSRVITFVSKHALFFYFLFENHYNHSEGGVWAVLSLRQVVNPQGFAGLMFPFANLSGCPSLSTPDLPRGSSNIWKLHMT